MWIPIYFDNLKIGVSLCECLEHKSKLGLTWINCVSPALYILGILNRVSVLAVEKHEVR